MKHPDPKLDNEAQRNLRGILAASGLTGRARSRILEVVSCAATLEHRIRQNDHTRDEYAGDNSYDARKAREGAREAVEDTRMRLATRLARLSTYAETRGAMLTDAVNGLANLGKTAEQLACEAVADGLAPFLKQHKCDRCGWRDVPYGSHAPLCGDCAYVIGECLNGAGLGMLPHVANRVAPLLRSVDADGVPGCGCGGPECSQCGTPQPDFDAPASARLTAAERDAFTL